MSRLTFGQSMRADGHDVRLRAHITEEVVATRIELARDELDKAISSLPLGRVRMILLQTDRMLQRLKADLGFPKAGLGNGEEEFPFGPGHGDTAQVIKEILKT